MVKLFKEHFINIFFAVLIVSAISILSILMPMAHQQVLSAYVGKNVTLLTPFHKESGKSQSGGTGFYITSTNGKPYIITNRHICQLSIDGFLWATNGDFQSDAKVKIIKMSNDYDLCLATSDKESGLSISGSKPEFHQTIAYVGYPRLQPQTFTMGELVGYQTVSIITGVIGKTTSIFNCTSLDSQIIEMPEDQYLYLRPESRIDFSTIPAATVLGKTVKLCVQTNKAMVTTLMIYPGASGSPIINFLGQVVGVVYSGPYQGGWGYGIMWEDLNNFLEGL